MGDAAAHLAGADDADAADLRHRRRRRAIVRGHRLAIIALMLGFLASASVELRHGLNRSADQAVVGDLEDRRLLVLVDGDDDLAVLHAGEVLDRARDADRDVELGRDDLAGLADLVVVRHEAGVDRGARGADRGAELVGERLEDA